VFPGGFSCSGLREEEMDSVGKEKFKMGQAIKSKGEDYKPDH